MKMSTRLIVGFGSILLMMSLLTVIGITKVNTIDNTLTQITDINAKKQRYAINFRGSVHDRAIALRDIVLVDSQQEFESTLTLIKQLDGFYQESAKALNHELSNSMEMSAKESDIYGRIQKVEEHATLLLNQVIQETENKNLKKAQKILLNKARPEFINWLNTINEFIDYQETLNKTATAQTREVASGFQTWMITLTIVALLLGSGLALFILRRINESVGGEPKEAEMIICKISRGNLTGIITTQYQYSIMGSIDRMQTILKDIVNNITNSSSELLVRAEKVSQSSTNSLNMANKQMEYTTSVVSSLEDMSQNINSIASVVHQTESNSRKTVELSLSGRESVKSVANEIEDIANTVTNTVQQVNLLEERATEIGNIVNVIRSIADQTNLLALNAAIEAARAGDAGRGFAVVADEVRQLAQRTGEATGEIENMISQVQINTQASVAAMETTVPKVEKGLVLTKEASKLLDEIQQQANGSLENVLEVVKDTNTQVSTIESIKETVTDLDNIAQETNGALKDSSEQANHLEKLSAKLSVDTDFFTI